MIFITSDLHFSHASIVKGVSQWKDKSGCRDFNSTHEMNSAITKSINKCVGVNDTLYHLGDWSFSGKESINVRHHINCKDIRLILGNHDHHLERGTYNELFTFVKHYHEFRYNKILFCLFHYSMRVWNQSHHGSIHLYGHSHGTLPSIGRSMDVGWDCYKRPLSIDEIVELLKDVPPHKIDHHNKETT